MKMDREDAFRELDERLNKSGNLVEVFSYGEKYMTSLPLLMSGNEDKSLRFYEFEKGVSIVNDHHSFCGTRSERISGFPDCEYKDIPTSGRWSNYYVLKDGKPITNEEEAVSIIKETMGVSIPKEVKEEKRFFSLDLDNYPKDKIITEIDIEKNQREAIRRVEYQPSDMKLSEQAYQIKKSLEKMPKEVGLESLDDFAKKIESIHSTADRISKPFERRLKKDEFFIVFE